MENQLTNNEQENELVLNPDVVINGQNYFYSPAHQLAKHICSKSYDGYRLTWEEGFTSATIYFEELIREGSFFASAKYGDKK